MHGRSRRAAAWFAHDALWLYPTLRRNCGWHGPVATRFETGEKEVWLTIDDGPDPHDTPEILGLLSQHRASATFFVIGKKAEQHRALCRRILAEGHTLGNHSHSHPSGLWWILPRPFVRREIARCNGAILTATGHAPRFFRSPVGMNNFSVHAAARDNGLRVAGWSADGCDGCPAAPTQIVSRIMSALRPGSIILIHEGGGVKHRVLTLARLLGILAEGGWRCVLPAEEALR